MFFKTGVLKSHTSYFCKKETPTQVYSCPVNTPKFLRTAFVIEHLQWLILNFAKFTGKHLCWNLLFNKVTGWSPVTFLKKTSPQMFSCEFHEMFKDTHREKAPSNKAPALAKSTNMGIWVVRTANQLFIRGS